MQTVAVDAGLRKRLITKRLTATQTQGVRHMCLYTFPHRDTVDTVALRRRTRLVHLLVETRFRDGYLMPHKRITTALDTTLFINLQVCGMLRHDMRVDDRIPFLRIDTGRNKRGVVPDRIAYCDHIVNHDRITDTEMLMIRPALTDGRVYIHRCCRYQQHTAQQSIEIMFHILNLKSQI